MGTYLYAIMAGEQHLELGQLGFPDGWTPITTLPHKGNTAIVSEHCGSAMVALPKADLLGSLAIHQRVIERAMENYPLLPVKFGTVLASDGEVGAVLEKWQPRISEALGHLDDSIEMEVAATWDLTETFAEIARQPEITLLTAFFADHSPEECVDARVRVGKAVKEALDRRREEYRERIVHDLAPAALKTQPNPLLTDQLVVNLAFLIKRTQIDDFYLRVTRLDEALGGRLTFRCVGPLPPYTFATVEIVRARPEAIAAARALLGLGPRISEAEVTASYRHLATKFHPDHNPQDPAAPERFAALAAARKLLLAYLNGQRGGVDGLEADGHVDLSPEGPGAELFLEILGPEWQPVPDGEGRIERERVIV